jgi:hypothetical protein
MDNRHQYLAIKNIKPGMVLADDLIDKLGRILLPAGTKLTDKILKSITQHQIVQLSILVNEVPGEEQDHELEKQKKIDRLEQLFRHGPYESPTNILKTYIYKYRAGDTP